MITMKKRKHQTIGGNALDGATTTGASWGFKPVPGKFGMTTNARITNKEGKKNA
jgi:hypothetical protein